MCHCSILDSFSLPFRDEETLANAQHKGWEDPVLEAMAAPGKVPEVVDAGAQKLAGDAVVRGFFDAQNGEWIENGKFRNDELWRRNEDTDDIGWKKVRDFQRLGSYSQFFNCGSHPTTGPDPVPVALEAGTETRESRHAQQRWLLCLHDLRPEWHTHLAVKFDRWEVWEGWILY